MTLLYRSTDIDLGAAQPPSADPGDYKPLEYRQIVPAIVKALVASKPAGMAVEKYAADKGLLLVRGAALFDACVSV